MEAKRFYKDVLHEVFQVAGLQLLSLLIKIRLLI